jgi:hypothetical protein
MRLSRPLDEPSRSSPPRQRTSCQLEFVALLVLALAIRALPAGALITVGALETPGVAQDIAIVGSVAYVADGSSLRVIDVSNRSEPRELSFLSMLNYTTDVFVAASFAYVADSSGLRVIDVSNPAAPREVGALATPTRAQGVVVAGGLAYVTAGNSGRKRSTNPVLARAARFVTLV